MLYYRYTYGRIEPGDRAGLRLRGSDAHAGALALARRCVAQLEQAAPGAGKAVHFELCGAADTEARGSAPRTCGRARP